MTYKIDKDVPVPSDIKGMEPGPERKALDLLKVGESILFPKNRANSARNAARNKANKDKTWAYTGQKQSDGNFRIWRLEQRSAASIASSKTAIQKTEALLDELQWQT